VAPYAARDLLSFIHTVRPDFIFFLAHLWAIPVVRRVMPKVKCHWHLALHDMPDTGGWVQSLGRKRATRFMAFTEELYGRASSQAVIGPEMADDMRLRTGIDCHHVFRCAVEPETMIKLQSPITFSKDDVIRIGYAGTIIAEETFARLVAALKVVRERIHRKIEIHLFSWHSYKNETWFDASLIIEHGAQTEAEIYKRYQELTWGLAIMKLDDNDPRYNRMSFPCKFTAALAAGLPLICMGNQHSALINLAKNYRLGLLFTDADVGQLEEKLCAGLTDFSRFPEYRQESARCAAREFNAERNRAELNELIRASMNPARQ
jgi:glycosyltransferase involved in cell wall biosynthesis